MEKEHKFDLNIAIPNGIILTAMGILVLLTPIFTNLTPMNLLIDVIAGILLTGGGGLSLFLGYRALKKKC